MLHGRHDALGAVKACDLRRRTSAADQIIRTTSLPGRTFRPRALCRAAASAADASTINDNAANMADVANRELKLKNNSGAPYGNRTRVSAVKGRIG